MSDRLTRVAFFTNTYSPDVNGVAHCVRAFRDELQRRGIEVYVFAPAPSGDAPEDDDSRVLRFPSVPLLTMDYSAAMPFSMTVSRTLRKVSFDLVHTHHPLWVGTWGAWYARRNRLPLVTTIHTHYELFAPLVPLPQNLVRAYLKGKVRRYCNRCHVVTTPVESNLRRLQKRGVHTPIVLVPNPINYGVFERADGSEVRAKYSVEDKFLMGYLGRLSQEKQLDTVLEAAASVCRRRRNAHLMVVGDGPVRRQLVEKARTLGLQECLTMVGGVPHEQVAAFHAAFDVFLTASIGETQPLAYAEAMAAGTPVIAVAGLGAVDMIEDGVNGFLVSRHQAAERMAEAVLRLIDDCELHRELMSNARQWARRYDISAAADRLLEAYELAMSRAGAQRPAGGSHS